MENSILDTTKKVLGVDSSDQAFDMDLIIYINSTFTVLNQLGVGPDVGFAISDADQLWDEYDVDLPTLSMVKSYVYLKVRMLFDPPTLSYLLNAYEKQIAEFEWRLCAIKESIPPVVV